jgi:hypothetical protein
MNGAAEPRMTKSQIPNAKGAPNFNPVRPRARNDQFQ